MPVTTPDTVEDVPTTSQKIAAEVLGTFVLVFFGCGAAIGSGLTSGNQQGYVVTGLTFGLTVLVMAYAVGRISGGHFNPAVSVGAALSGRLPWAQAGIYIVAQVLGGILAAAALFGILHGFEGFGHGESMAQNAFGDESGLGIAWWSAFLLEMLLTAVFLWVILGATDERNSPNVALAPLAIGFSLAMIHFASMFATGTSVNPARSIGPALFAGTEAITQLWLFILAPLLGGAIAGLTYPLLFGRGAEPVAGSGLGLGRGKKAAAFPPGNFEAQWNPGQMGGWNQPQQAPWSGSSAPQQPAGQQWGAPGAPQQWGAPPAGAQPPYGAPQAPASAPQWGAPPADPYGTPQGAPEPHVPAPGQPGHWGNPEGDDDGRTQVRRPD